MKESIYTIPINESFEELCGCPFCRLESKMELDSIDILLGAAMMDPDVRIKTNEQGFCGRHAASLLQEQKRLPLSLILESHLIAIQKLIDAAEQNPLKGLDPLVTVKEDCYLCAKVDAYMQHIYSGVAYMYETEPAFVELYKKQPYFCLRHLTGFLQTAKRKLGKKAFIVLAAESLLPTKKALAKSKSDISAFCKSFDYRAAGQPLSEDAQTSIEKTLPLLYGITAEK